MIEEEQINKHLEQAIPYLELMPAAVTIHHIQDNQVLYMNKRGLNALNTTLGELKAMGSDYHNIFFNQEDSKDYVPRLFEMIQRNADGEVITFFQQVRLFGAQEWQWCLSSVEVFMRNGQGMPILTISISVLIDREHHINTKVERLLQENTFLRSHKDLFAGLTRRERQMLSMMALDKTSLEISKQLFLSEETVKTHRRNIKKKIGAQNQYDIVRFAQSFDMI